MGNKQVYFAIAVGFLLMALGGAITMISQTGWSLFTVGALLTTLSIIVKIFNKQVSADILEEEYKLEAIETHQADIIAQEEEVRHAA